MLLYSEEIYRQSTCPKFDKISAPQGTGPLTAGKGKSSGLRELSSDLYFWGLFTSALEVLAIAR